MDYTKITNQGYKIVAKLQLDENDLAVVVDRGHDFAWGNYYNEQEGYWAHGHYDFKTKQDAIESMIQFKLNKKLIDEDKKSVEEYCQDYKNQLVEEDLELDRSEASLDEFEEELTGQFKREYECLMEALHEEYLNDLKDMRAIRSQMSSS